MSSCWKKNFTRNNAHNFFILSLVFFFFIDRRCCVFSGPPCIMYFAVADPVGLQQAAHSPPPPPPILIDVLIDVCFPIPFCIRMLQNKAQIARDTAANPGISFFSGGGGRKRCAHTYITSAKPEVPCGRGPGALSGP